MLFLLYMISLVFAAKPSWHIAMTVDQSDSMTGRKGYDPAGFSLIGPAILADLSQEGDQLVIYPQTDRPKDACHQFPLDPRNRDDFKIRLKQIKSSKCTGSNWEGNLVKAIDQLKSTQRNKNLFINIYDGGKPFSNSQQRRKELKSANINGFVLGIGPKAKEPINQKSMQLFGRSHGIEVGQQNHTEFLKAFGQIFNYILDSSVTKVDNFRVNPNGKDITLTIPPDVSQAWLVALTKDQPVRTITAIGSDKGGLVDGSGFTHPTSKWGYKIFTMKQPREGTWEFEIDTQAKDGSYMLLLSYDIDISLQVPPCKSDKNFTITMTPNKKLVDVKNIRAYAIFPNEERIDFKAKKNGSFALKKSVGIGFAERVQFVLERPGQFKVTKSKYISCADEICPKFKERYWPTNYQVTLDYFIEEKETKALLNHKYEKVALKVGDNPYVAMPLVGKNFQFTSPGALRQDRSSETVTLRSKKKKASSFEQCSTTWHFLPAVRPHVSAGSINVGPVEYDTWWNPVGGCQQEDRSDGFCDECGSCGGAIWRLNVEATKRSSSFQAYFQVNKMTIKKNGEVSSFHDFDLYWASGPLKSTAIKMGKEYAITIPTNHQTMQPLSIAACSKICPEAGEIDVHLTMKAKNVLSYDKVEKKNDRLSEQDKNTPEDLTFSTTLKAKTQPSSSWACWAKRIYTTIACLLFGFWIYGFIKPFRFPNKGTLSNPFPAYFNTFETKSLGKSNSDPLVNMLQTDAYAPTTTWYKNEILYLRGDELSLSRSPENAVAAIELRRDEVTKRPLAFFKPLAGQKWQMAEYIEGLKRRSYKAKLEDIPPEGCRLQLEYIYMFHYKEKPSWCCIFSNRTND